MPVQPYYADLAGIFMGAMQQSAQRKRAEREQQRYEQQQRAQQDAMKAKQQGVAHFQRTGDISPLMQVDPELATKVQGANRSQVEFEQGQQKAQLDDMQKRISAASKWGATAPEEFRVRAMSQAVQPYAKQLGLPEVRPGQPYTPEELDLAMGRAASMGVLGQGDKSINPMSNIGKKVFDLFGLRPGDPGVMKAAEEVQQMEAAAAKALQESKSAAEAAPKLRQEFQKLDTVKDTMDVATQYAKIQAATPTAAGDLNLIFGYMKMLDPGSTVREGEFANAENAQGVEQRVVSTYNRLLRGERLAPESRAQFKKEAAGVWSAQKSRYDRVAEHYGRLAEKAQVDPADVVLDVFSPTEEQKQRRAKARKAKKKAAQKQVKDPAAAQARIRELLAQQKTPEEIKAIMTQEGY